MSTVEGAAPEHEISNPVEECKKVSLLTRCQNQVKTHTAC